MTDDASVLPLALSVLALRKAISSLPGAVGGIERTQMLMLLDKIATDRAPWTIHIYPGADPVVDEVFPLLNGREP